MRMWFPTQTPVGIGLTRTTSRARATKAGLAAFSFLFSEIVQYCQTRVSNVGELERR